MFETPWRVVGFEKWQNERDEVCVRLYVVRALSLAEGHTGSGAETKSFYFKPLYVKYEPVIGHHIIPVDGRYGLMQVMVVGQDKIKE